MPTTYTTGGLTMFGSVIDSNISLWLRILRSTGRSSRPGLPPRGVRYVLTRSFIVFASGSATMNSCQSF